MSESHNSLVCVIHSPMEGTVYPLENVPDPGFSKRIIGDGVAIVPSEPTVYTPLDGKVVSVFETKHAIVFENEQKFRILLHVGIGSMRLQGRGFETFVKNGQEVKKGDKLLSVDLEYLDESADALASPIVLENREGRYEVAVVAKGHIKVGEPLFEIYEADETI